MPEPVQMVSRGRKGNRSIRRHKEAERRENSKLSASLPRRLLAELQITRAGGYNRQGDVESGFVEMDDDFHCVQLRLVNDIKRDVGSFEILRCILSSGPLVRPGVKKPSLSIPQQYFHSAIKGV
jgi:hypothetical protein